MTAVEDSTGLVEMAWDPITRIVGSLGIYTKIDFKQKKVVECHSTSSIFRGYSIFMKGKDPRDAHFITSRICGICGDNHATCSVYNQNMAYGVRPPHLGEWIINLGEAAEYMFDHNIFQENLVGVDFCERMVGETNPGVLELANRTRWKASSTARLFRYRGRPGRCSASWRAATCTPPRSIRAAWVPLRQCSCSPTT
jgi:hydrogenase large subunit